MKTELEKIYLERENKLIELIKTLSWEEARTIVDEEYKEQILSICPEKPLKRGFCVNGKPIQFEIIGGYNYSKDYDGNTWNAKINGKYVFKRILIKKVS